MPISPSPSTRTASLGLALAAIATPLLLLSQASAQLTADIGVRWWMLAIAFFLAELAAFHLEFQEEAHTFTLSELPLLLGIFFAMPGALILGRVVGEAIGMWARGTRDPLKLGFNLALFWRETALALAVYHLLLGSPDPLHVQGWIAGLGALAVADVVGVLAVGLVIRWHSGVVSFVGPLVAAAVSALGNGSLGVVASLLAISHPPALGLLGVLAVIVVAAYRGYSALKQRYDNLHLLYDFTDAISGSNDPSDLMAAILDYARRLLRAEMAEVVLLAAPDHPALRFGNAAGGGIASQPVPHDLLALLDLRVGAGSSLLAPSDTRDQGARMYLDLLGLRDAIVVPLQVDATVVGAITVGNRLSEVSTFDPDDRRLFETLGNHAAMALENSRLISELREEARAREHQAMHDALTGLPNRTLFTARCAEVVAGLPDGEGGQLVGVVLMDVDRFKEVNDTLGHHIGDELLVELGNRLRAALPDRATVARLGGDEFALLLPEEDSLEHLLLLAGQVRTALAEPVRIHELELVVEVSVGLALAPDHGTDPLTLLQRADVAMYNAKAARSGVAVYHEEHDPHTPRRLAMAAELRDAITQGQLEVYYQPKAALGSGQIVGAEALVRWHHPEHGFVSPGEFIPLAERTDLIGPLTELVLDDAIRQCARWRAAGHEMSVAVNVAVRSLLDEALIRQVRTAVSAADIPFSSLVLEVTESGIMTDAARAIDMLDRIAAIGVQLSVDDFGTGYSSLAYLQRLPVHEVKIDRAFVFNAGTDGGDAAIVRSITELGHSLGLRVVAEGVENQLTLDTLEQLGCDVAQGYFLSRPISAAQFDAWLAMRTLSRA